MYTLQEKPVNILMLEGTRLLDKLSNQGIVGKTDIQQFGNALLEVQSETRKQLVNEHRPTRMMAD
jgi:hypothetical protein